MNQKVVQRQKSKSQRKIDRVLKRKAAAEESVHQRELARYKSNGYRIVCIIIIALITDTLNRFYGGYWQGLFSSEWGKIFAALSPYAVFMLFVWFLWPRKF